MGFTWVIFSVVPMYFVFIEITVVPRIKTKLAWCNKLFPWVFKLVSAVVLFYVVFVFNWALSMVVLSSAVNAYGWLWIWPLIWEWMDTYLVNNTSY